jgi:rod shape determining protein RodA
MKNRLFFIISILLYAITIILLIAVLFVGLRISGATRWLSIAGFRLQPSELAKPALALMLGVIFTRFSVNSWKEFWAGAAAMIVPFFLIYKEPDLGSAVILVPVYIGIVFISKLRWKYLIFATIAALLVGGAAIANEAMKIKPLLKNYQRDRIMVFLNPESDRLNRGYNAYQARLAVGSGGTYGKGIGEGTQNSLGFLPHTVSNNDFIFSVIAEETGFVGCALLLLGYLLLFISILRTAILTDDNQCRCFAVGTGIVFFSHVFINIGMSIGITPVTGLPLPLISYGGSSLLVTMASLGLLQSIYRNRPTDKRFNRNINENQLTGLTR